MGGRYRGEEEVRLNGQHLGGAWGAGRRSRGRVLVWWCVSGCTGVLVTERRNAKITFEGRQIKNSQSVFEVPLGHKERERDVK